MGEETVNPQEEVIEAPVADEVEEQEEAEQVPIESSKVPLSALQKERRKRQELELELKWMKEQQAKPPAAPEPDESRYESATREDLSKTREEIIRDVEERRWMRENPERFEKVNELLPEFLKRRPNLANAIASASNRYEEAWELMDKLSPKEQQKLRSAPARKEAPGNPASVPKGAAMAQAVDVMTMNDAEYSAWRKEQKRNR
jgi:hypothetical protein